MVKIPDSLKQALREKRAIPFIGAGLSRNVKDKSGNTLFPDWPTLLRDSIPKLKADGKDAKANRVAGALDDNPPDYLEAAKHAGEGLGSHWYDYLKDVFQRPHSEVDESSLELSRLCWQLGSNLLITGNYEDVLKWGCPSINDLKIWDIEAVKEQVDLLKNNASTRFPTIWHLHGHIGNVRNLILTPDGYNTLYPQDNGDIAKQKYEAALAVLRALIAIRPFLFIGFSMDDHQFDTQMKFVSELFQGTSEKHYILLRVDAAQRFEPRENLEVISFERFDELPGILKEIAEIAAEVPDTPNAITINTADASSKPADRQTKTPFNIPFRPKGDEFVGREGKLEEIHNALKNSPGVAIGQAVGIEGLGGLGKTQLAVEYAYKYRGEYPNGVIWFTADGDMEGQLRAIALEAEWAIPVDTPENQLIVARQALKNLKDALLIFDNVNNYADIEPYLPKADSNTHILATAREKLPKLKRVELFTLPLDESRKLIIKTAGREPQSDLDKTALEEILKILDGLPLALEMAGAYLRETAICTWCEYLKLLEQKPEAAFDEAFVAGSFTGHDEGVYRTLRISNTVLDKTPYLREILDILTWSGSSSIGIPLLCEMLGVSGKADIMLALGKAVRLCFINWETETDRYSIHRLLAKVRRSEIPLDTRKEWVGESVRKLGAWFTEIKEDFTKLADFENELEHLEAWEQNASDNFSESVVRLIFLKAYPAYHRGKYVEAEQWTKDAYNRYKTGSLADKVLLADILYDLGFLAYQRGAPSEALKRMEQVLDTRREMLGEKHPDYAKSLSSIGAIYGEMGNHKKALEFKKQALDMQKEILGENHPAYATTLNNIGISYSEMKDQREALQFLKRALDIRKEILGEKHPDYAGSLSSIGAIYGEMGNHKKALEFKKQALDMQKEILGENHPDYAASLNNIGVTYLKLKDKQRAKDCFARAVLILTESLGPNHRNTQTAEAWLDEAKIAVGGKPEAIKMQIASRKKKAKKKR